MPTQFRGGRALKRNESGALPRYIIAVDTETMPRESPDNPGELIHDFRIGHAISCRLVGTKPIGRKDHQLTSTDQFWKLVAELSGPRHTLWVVAHNALFDFETLAGKQEFMMGRMSLDWPRSKRKKSDDGDEHKQEFSLAVVDGPPTIIACRVHSTQGRVVIVDTLNWFKGTLCELGKVLGKEKYVLPQWSQSDSDWASYCKNDAEIVYDTFIGLIDFVSANDFGMFRYTAAGQSYSAFRHKYMDCPIYFHDDPAIKSLERRACFGGRSEVFRQGEYHGTFYQLDINSLYPSVMMANDFPYTIDDYEFSRESLVYPAKYISNRSIAECSVDTITSMAPKRVLGRTIYPVGQFNTVLAGPELQNALRSGQLSSVRSYSNYKLAPIFRRWVADLWDLRRKYKADGNGIYDQFVKMLLNSLYGKFSQLSPVWIRDNSEPVVEPWAQWSKYDCRSGEIVNYRSFGWQAEKLIGKQEKAATLPAISAFVTAYARLRMNGLREIAGKDNVYYQAVDSMIVTEAGRNALYDAGEVSDCELGKLKTEVKADYVRINGIGDYVIGDKRILSGCARNCTEIEDGVYLQRVFTAKNQLFNGMDANAVTEREQIFRAKREYHKGLIKAGGWLDPFTLPNEELLSLSADNWD